MKYKSIFGTALSLLLAGSIYSAPSPDEIEILDLMVRGSGCPAGTTGVMFTSTTPGGPADFFEVIFDEFAVEKGPGVGLTEKRKFCSIVLSLSFPQGFTFSMADVHFEGYAEIGEDSVGELKTEYYFPFHSEKEIRSKTLNGPFEDDFSQQDTTSIFNPVWAPCGFRVPLNVKTTLNLKGPRTDPALMTVDQATGMLKQLFHIKWREC